MHWCIGKRLKSNICGSYSPHAYPPPPPHPLIANNYFQFADKMYHQKQGCAMGTVMAPSYACLLEACNIIIVALTIHHEVCYNFMIESITKNTFSPLYENVCGIFNLDKIGKSMQARIHK